jgi:hypothetical protein
MGRACFARTPLPPGAAGGVKGSGPSAGRSGATWRGPQPSGEDTGCGAAFDAMEPVGSGRKEKQRRDRRRHRWGVERAARVFARRTGGRSPRAPPAPNIGADCPRGSTIATAIEGLHSCGLRGQSRARRRRANCQITPNPESGSSSARAPRPGLGGTGQRYRWGRMLGATLAPRR